MPTPPSNGIAVPYWHLDTRNPWARRSYWGHIRLGLILFALPLLGHNPQSPVQNGHNAVADVQVTAGARPEITARLGVPPNPKPGHVSSPQPVVANKLVDSKPVSVIVTANAGTVSEWCNAVADRLFSVQLRDCHGRGYIDSGYRSVQGRVIAVRDVHATKIPQLGRVLLIGGTHGDELTSVSIVFWWLQMLDKQPSGINWRIAPVMNPDGVLAHPPTRLNANKIDLNRNLPTPGWAQASRAYWQEVGKEPRRYPGVAPGSEPETQWLMRAIKIYKPDVIVSVHAPYGVLDYDGHYPPPQHLGDLSLHQLGVFPGSLGNYGSRHLGIPVITVELTHATRMPSRKRARAMWRDLNGWLQEYLGHKRAVKQ